MNYISYQTYQTCTIVMFCIIIILFIIAVKQYRKNKRYRGLDAALSNVLESGRSVAEEMDHLEGQLKYQINENKLNNLLTIEEEKFVEDFYEENPSFK